MYFSADVKSIGYFTCIGLDLQ